MSNTLASPIARPSVGRTFIVAVSLVGLIGLVQLGAVGWVFVGSFHSLTERAKMGPRGQEETGDGSLASGATNETLEAENPFAAEGSDNPIAPPDKPVPVSAMNLNPPAEPPETRFEELILQARQLRERGDTGAALTKLREAQALEPRNPEAMAETAITFEKMTLTERASEQWRTLYEMGEAAGAFYLVAESRMKMSKAQALAAVQMTQGTSSAPVDAGPVSSLRDDATLGIGEIARTDKPDSAGTRFILRIPIKARGGSERISVADVDIQVFFYDEVNGDAVVQTDADLSYRFASSPIDWSTSDPETLEIEYSRQPPIADKRSKAEKRVFHGYTARIYFRGELQDSKAEPASLAEKYPAPQSLDTKNK